MLDTTIIQTRIKQQASYPQLTTLVSVEFEILPVAVTQKLWRNHCEPPSVEGVRNNIIQALLYHLRSTNKVGNTSNCILGISWIAVLNECKWSPTDCPLHRDVDNAAVFGEKVFHEFIIGRALASTQIGHTQI